MRHRKVHENRKAEFGELSEAYSAMQSCMAWDTIYEPKKDRVVTPVSRIWNIGWGGCVLFCWDTYFAAYMAALDSRELAMANAIEITQEAVSEGFVPNFAADEGRKSFDRSQPPVGSLVVREVYRRYPERWFLELLFPQLLKWNTWFYENRQVEPGLLAWGSNPYPVRFGSHWETAGVGDTYGAALESGLDNSPMYDDVPFDRERCLLELADVGLTGLFVMDCSCLADIAAVLGRNAEAELLKERQEACEQGLQSLWVPDDNAFLNKRTDSQEYSRRVSPTNFYALLSSVVRPEQCEGMLARYFYNPEHFWGPWLMPSISRSDPAYAEQDYWRGRIWAPMNFLVYLGLRKNGLDQAASELASRSTKLLLKEWLSHGHVHENYCADTGEGCNRHNSDRFYHWGGLLSLIALIESDWLAGWETPLSVD